jgi:hypothetical protein
MSSIYQVNKQYGLALAALQRIVDEFPGSENSDAFLAQRNIDRLEATIAELQTDAVAELEKSGKHNRVTSIPAGQTVTWTPADGPYLIEEMLTVPADSVVNIEAGTVLRFGMSAGLRVSGRVEAAGTADAPVRCLALSDDPSASLWSGLTFEASGDGMPSTLTHLHTSAARHAIAVTSGSVTVTDCTLQHSVRAGLMSRDAGSITAKNCQIVGGRSEGIVCENGGKVIVDGGRIADQARSGISVKLTRASSTVTGTVIENNGGDGVSFMTATGTLKDCRIRGNGGSGVVCRGDAAPTIEACDITENQKMGIACLDRSKPRITRTNIRMSKGGGIRFETASDGNVTDSVIEDNELFGVSCKLSNPRIAGSRITGNAEVGVDIESGQPKLHKNDLAGNKGITLRNQSSAVVDARENWWGSAEPAEIDKQIEDAADNADWGKVNYDPPLKNATEAKN